MDTHRAAGTAAFTGALTFGVATAFGGAFTPLTPKPLLTTAGVLGVSTAAGVMVGAAIDDPLESWSLGAGVGAGVGALGFAHLSSQILPGYRGCTVLAGAIIGGLLGAGGVALSA